MIAGYYADKKNVKLLIRFVTFLIVLIK